MEGLDATVSTASARTRALRIPMDEATGNPSGNDGVENKGAKRVLVAPEVGDEHREG